MGMVLRGDRLCAVLYDTARRLTLRSIILRGDTEKIEYFSKNETKNENILTHWSVTRAGSKDEKKTGDQKSRWNVPLEDHSHEIFGPRFY